jgi:NTP pyrophosphatase (non-canonical NTP hydrolase)
MTDLQAELVETTFEGYQNRAVKTAIYPLSAQVTYPAMGLANEAGEVLGKVKKIIRDGTYVRDEIVDELGDVLWYAAALARDLDVSLTEVAHRNLKKLEDRAARGVLKGSGDKR